MELLAPAGSFEALQAAIYAGANAIYLGGKMFNARKGAANFTFKELKDAVQLAHDYEARIYVTVNTLTHEHELKDMAGYLYELANHQVDAFIVQDLGVAKLAHAIAPHIELHASTQMTIHSAKALKLLGNLGFKRVVLAREVSLKDIDYMHKSHPDIGLEVFAHGALCYAYSGQCLMSSFIGGRSGNRGACAGPCRLPYTLLCNGLPLSTNYIMSPRDLCLITELELLKNAGVSSIKIEGRLKRPEYVYTVVQHYRQALDAGADYAFSTDIQKDLKQAFNRGFTKGLVLGESGRKLMGVQQPDNRGLDVAEIIGYKNGTILVKASVQLEKGDVLAWRIKNNTNTIKITASYKVNEIFSIRTDKKVPKGTIIRRVISVNQQREAAQAMRRPVAKFGLELFVKLNVGKVIELTGKDSSGFRATVYGNKPLEKALNRPTNEEYVKKQLGRLGGTLWRLEHCDIEINGEPIVTSAELNDCRRRLVSLLLKMRREHYTNQQCLGDAHELIVNKTATIKPVQQPKLAVTVGSLAEAKAALRAGADLLYVGRAEWLPISDKELKQILDLAAQKFVWRLPRIAHESDLKEIKQLIDKYKEWGLKSIAVNTVGQLSLVKDMSNLECIADSGLPVFNHLTAEFLKDESISQITVSSELNSKQMQCLASRLNVPFEIIVHGKILLMIHESCILKGIDKCQKNKCSTEKWALEDRKQYRFPLTFDKKHRSYLYNSKDLALIDKLPEILTLKPAVLRVEGAGRGVEYLESVTRAYRSSIDYLINGQKNGFYEVVKQFNAESYEDFTRGHWQRGV